MATKKTDSSAIDAAMKKVEAKKADEAKKAAETKVAAPAKKEAAKAPAKKEAAKAPAKKEAAPKKEEAKKAAPAKKAAAPKKEAAKAPAKKAAPAKKSTGVFVKLETSKGDISIDDIVAKIQEQTGKKAVKEVYVQPENNVVFYVADGADGSVALFD